MSTTRPRVARQRSVDRRSGGFSLIELTLAVTIAVVIGMGLYFIFTAQQRASRSQKSYNDLQTSCSFAMDTIKSDLLLAGYRAQNTLEPISGPGASAITFEYWDDNASADPPYDDVTQWTPQTQVTYSLSGNDLNKTIRRWHLPGPSYDVPLTFPLAKNVQSLGFAYFKEDNVPWTSTESKSLIRTVRVSLTCRAAQADALHVDPTQPGGTPKYQVIALTAEVRPRNIAVAEAPEDKTPPAVPLSQLNAKFWAWDEGDCGCLKLRWTSNSDADIAGYTVYYGLVAGTYIGRARASHQDGMAEQEFQLRNLGETNTPYFIALAAYDKSGNQSALSAAVSGNPTPSIRAKDDTANDTAINPDPPPAPGAPTVSTPADNHLQISWQTNYTDCNTTPDFGYRLYRSTDPNFVPEGDEGGEGNCIADEFDLSGPTATSYLDTGVDTAGGSLTGCIPWYYKVAVANCDPTQLTNFTDLDPATTSNYTTAQFASVVGTPTDGTRTSAPVLTAIPGFRRITLTIEHPPRSVYPDFMHTRVYFSTTAPGPQITEERDEFGFNRVTNGRLVPDHDGIFGLGAVSTESFNFDDENNEVPPGGLLDPQLREDATYYFLAVSYDTCKNHAEGDVSRDAARQCNDCEEGLTCRDAPPAPENLRVTEGCNGAPLRLEWDYPESYYSSHPDLQGFRVVRCQGDGCVPSDPALGGTGTLLTGTYLIGSTTFLDDSVSDGELYKYRVYAGDCYYQSFLEGVLTAEERAANPPENNADFRDIEGVALGFFDRARVEGDLQTTLTADIDNLTTTIPVVSTAGWSRKLLIINSEVIQCAAFEPNAFTGCTRGMEGPAAGHLAGTPVTSYPEAPSRAAQTGDLSLVPPTFLHNTLIVAARNTSAGSLTLNELTISWDDPASWFTELIYNDTVEAFTDPHPFEHDYSGSTVTLSPVVVDPLDQYIPLKLTFKKSDGTVDPTIDLREDEFILNWLYRNNATGIATCNREWRPPAVAGIVGPPGPTIMGTTQSAPTDGTVAWPVPGLQNNPPNAIISPSDLSNTVSTNVRSSVPIASVRLYYTTTDPADDVAPATSGAYPGCAPYTMVEMGRIGTSNTFQVEFPVLPRNPAELNDRNVWYYIVAVDEEGNFDREPEAGQGAFQYYQQPVDPCLSTPAAPLLENTFVTSSSVLLDWSASWSGTPPVYYNTDANPCTDLAGFRVYHQITGGGWFEVPGSPFPPTTTSFTDTFTTPVATLSAAIDAGATVIPVDTTADFRGSGKIRIDSEIIAYSGKTTNSFVGCARGRDLTLPTGHAAGSAATQDLLALETNSYFVRAFDSCPTGAKFQNSATFTEQSDCNPRCDLQVSPAGGSIVPGDTFSVQIGACQLAGNGKMDTIYVHVCSGVEGDDLAITEDVFDGGTFDWDAATQLGNSSGGGNSLLMVAANDRISVGGFSLTQNSWGDVNICTGKTYSCGGEEVVEVNSTPVDFCADPPSLGTPFSLQSAVATGTTCSGAGTSKMTLSWSPVGAPSRCTNFFYRGFMCEGLGCEPNLAISGFFTSTAENCSAGSTCTSNTIDVAPSKFTKKVYRFAVQAVCETNNCPVAPTTRAWESSVSATAEDPCQ